MSDDRHRKGAPGGLTRREFLTTMGAGAAAAAVTGGVAPGVFQEGQVMEPEELVKVSLVVNGRRRQVLVEPRWTLLYVLREHLGLTGAKAGCERGECGACTVLIDNVPRYACMTLALEAEGTKVTTVEGLMDGEELGEVQQAFMETDAFQCGYCTSGQVMAAEGLLRKRPDPTTDEIRRDMSGNLCRCGAYPHITHAVKRAGDLKRRGGK